MGTRTSAIIPVLGVVALAAVVAVTANGTSVWATPRSGSVDRAQVLALVAVVSVLCACVAGAAVFVLSRASVLRRRGSPAATLLVRALPFTVVGVALVSLLVVSRVELRPGGGGARERAAQPELPGRSGEPLTIVGWWNSPVKAGEGEAAAEGVAGRGSDGFPIPSLGFLILALGAIGGAAWWLVSRSRRSQTPASEESDADAARRTVEGTIDSMLLDPDPRTAIIGAYARLLEGLATCGARRCEHEGPMEHLHRVLTVLEVRADPLQELIELFEIARFSDHRVTVWHRQRALEALREVGDDLSSGSLDPQPTGDRTSVGS